MIKTIACKIISIIFMIFFIFSTPEKVYKLNSIHIKENIVFFKFIGFCVAHLVYHNYLACCNSLIKRYKKIEYSRDKDFMNTIMV